MTSNTVLRRAIRYALYANAAAAAAAVPAVAAAADTEPAEAPVTEVVVTGSRIVEPGLQSISPVTTVSAEEISRTGVTRVEDLLNSLPQVMADQGGNISNGATGIATVDLRGLGPQRTLVLINGRRLMPGTPNNAGVSNGPADLNQIPAALVERVDVLTGGASSVYGADAVAGVVNFIMNDHFEGFRIDANAAMNNHQQHNYFGQFAPAAGFGEAPSTVNDGKTKDITFILGGNFADGKGNVTMYAGYHRIDALLQAERDFSRCTLGFSHGTPVCGGSSTSALGRFIFAGPQGGTGYTLVPNATLGPNQTFVPYTSANAYNYGALNYYQRPDERWTGGAFAHYNMDEHHEVYMEFMSMQDRSIAQIAPSGAFLASGTGEFNGIPNGAWVINCNNPFMSASQQAALCGNNSGVGAAEVLLGRRNVEGGPRYDDLTHTSFRAVVGFKGEFADAWSYDTYFQEGKTLLSENYVNDVSKSKLAASFLAVTDPLTGKVVCAANANGANGAPGCVPYNVFGSTLGGITPAQASAYFTTPGFQEGANEERVASGNITGDLTKYGVKLPSASTGLIVNIGAEYRQEFTDLKPDIEFQTNDLAGQGNPTLPLNAGYHVWEGFAEARMPLVQDHTAMKELSLEAGYRYSDYTIGFSTNTYKFGVDWAPTSDLRLRGSYNRAVRVPNLAELYAQNFVGNDFGSDPCAYTSTSTPATATLQQCMRSGVTAAQYGTFGVPGNPAGQYQGLIGGNPNLKPETADTYTFGLVLTPTFAPAFNMTIDYFDIKIKDVISSYGGEFTINECQVHQIQSFCDLIHRDSLGSLWLTPLSYVTDQTLNLGSFHTQGVDITANYRLDMGRGGHLDFQLAGTYTASFITEPVPGLGEYDCAGYFGNTCGNPLPKWRHKLRSTWSTPVKGLEASLQWRHLNSTTADTNSPNPLLNGSTGALDNTLGTRDYFDLSVAYQVTKGISTRIGVNNMFDKDPPIVAGGDFGSAFVNGNTYPQVYDTLGRYIFLNITADF